MKIKRRCLNCLVFAIALTVIFFCFETNIAENKHRLLTIIISTPDIAGQNGTPQTSEMNLSTTALTQQSSIMNGEERAQQILERCQKYPDMVPCLYPSRSVEKRMLPVLDKKFALCVMGKTGSSNWKTLILQMRGVITAEEAKNMIYPHTSDYWTGNSTLHYIIKAKNKQLENTIKNEFYKMSFIRDPLERLLSAYRDKFTGTSRDRIFRVYRRKRADVICSALQDILETQPDGDLLLPEIYAYMSDQLNQHCKNLGKNVVSLGIFFMLLIFVPQDLNDDDTLKDIVVNTHFSSMLSMCDHCRQKYDFIGTLETMDSDFAFLRSKFDIEYDLPKVDSTQPGVISKKEVEEMWLNIPDLLKQYVYLHIGDDATILGYNGYHTYIDKSLYPNHNEREKKCIYL